MADRTEMERCDGCRWFDPWPDGDGYCRWKPPPRVQSVYQSDGWIWPKVKADEWCSAHQPNPADGEQSETPSPDER